MDLVLQVFVAALVFGSGLVWWRVGAAVHHGRHPLAARPHDRPQYHPFVIVLVAAWIALELATRMAAEFRIEPITPSLAQIRGACVIAFVSWAILMLLLAGTSSGRLGQFGITLRRLGESARNGGMGFLASVLPVLLALLATSPFRTEENQHSFLRVIREQSGFEALAWITLAVVVLAPLSEELLFRVTLQGWLQTRYPPAWAIGMSAALFSAVHGWPDSLPLLPLAIILGYMYWRTHDYLSIVIVHGLFNLMSVVIAGFSEAQPPQAMSDFGSRGGVAVLGRVIREFGSALLEAVRAAW